MPDATLRRVVGTMQDMSEAGMRAALAKMRAAGAHPEAIRAFARAYERLDSGETAMLPSAELEPAGDVPALEDLPDVDPRQALAPVVVIKLNGGLATTMGLQQPKSLMEARDGKSFLDIIIGQTLALRRRHDVELPLVLMDSESTREPTLAELARHPELSRDGIEPDFMQSVVPKLVADTLEPVSWPAAPALEWNPPGHGDVYGALRRSGMLDALLERGFRYAMISNADNLGSSVEPRIAGHMAANEIPFLMEVAQGTEADRKGGHVARRIADGRLVLRESAQTPDEDEESFRDFRKWRWYNTNSLWVDLQVLAERLEQSEGVLELPIIINRKTVDPRDADSTPVIQLESAMGAAIGSFPGAAAPARPSHPLRPGQDHRRPARPALRCLRVRRRPARGAGARARRQSSLRRARQALLPAHRRLRAAVPRGPALAARGRAAGGQRRRHLRRGRPHPRHRGARSRRAHHHRPRHRAGAVSPAAPHGLPTAEAGAADPSAAGTITIVLADDHEVVRAGLRLLLDAEPGFAVVSEAGDVALTERRVAAHRPRVLILDVNMPDGSSLPAIPRLRAASPETHIVMLTMQNDPELAREALRAGATGFVLKESAKEELIQAVRLAAGGRTYLNPELGARLATEAPPVSAAPDDLSAREIEVLRLIAVGHTNGEIATQLFLSVRTVESHRAHIQQKTQRSSRAELVAYARDNGLL